MSFLQKYIATIIGVLFFVVPLIMQFLITDLFGLIFFGSTLWSFIGVGKLTGVINDQISMNSLVIISSFLNLAFSILVSFFYFKIIKSDKFNNKFSLLFLLLFFMIQHFFIHQLYYGVLVTFNRNYLDGNDFLGVISTGFYSSFLFIIFGIIIDYIKNKNGVPQILPLYQSAK